MKIDILKIPKKWKPKTMTIRPAPVMNQSWLVRKNFPNEEAVTPNKMKMVESPKTKKIAENTACRRAWALDNISSKVTPPKYAK